MTRAELVVLRDAAKAAYLKAVAATEYSISSGNASRTLKRQSLETLRSEWMKWQAEIDALDLVGRRIKFCTPRY